MVGLWRAAVVATVLVAAACTPLPTHRQVGISKDMRVLAPALSHPSLALPNATDVVGLHNLDHVVTTARPVYSACVDGKGVETLEQVLEGLVMAVDSDKGVVRLLWKGTVEEDRVACDAKLFFNASVALQWGCDALSPPPLYTPQQHVSHVPLTGWIDTHTHMFAEYGFGGHNLWGSALGNESEALKPCDGQSTHGLGVFPDFDFHVVLEQLFSCEPFSPVHTHNSTDGFPTYTSWPRWNDHAHHQEHVTMLRKSFDQGQRAVVISTVNNEVLCHLNAIVGTPSFHGSGACDDDTNLREQVAKVKEMAEENKDWMEIALNATHFHSIVAGNRLAVVLSVEVSDLFGAPPNSQDMVVLKEWVDAKLDALMDLGIRSFQPVHEFSNAYGGAADVDESLRQIAEVLELKDSLFGLGAADDQTLVQLERLKGGSKTTLASSKTTVNNPLPSLTNAAASPSLSERAMHMFAHCPLTLFNLTQQLAAIPAASPHVAHDMEPNRFGGQFNSLGLTPLGRLLVREAMRKGFLVDFAHLSRKAGRDAFEIAMEHGGFPVFVSHAPFLQLDPWLNNDYAVDSEVLQWVAATGGMWGLRTGPMSRPTFRFTRVPNDCHGSIKSFAQEYQLAQYVGTPFGFAPDFNGYALNMAPRFGKADETCAALWREASCHRNVSAPDLEAGETMSEWVGLCQGLAAERDAQQLLQGTRAANGTLTALDTNGLASADLMPAMLDELRALGLSTPERDHSVDMFSRMWERAERDTRRTLTDVPSETTFRTALRCAFWGSNDDAVPQGAEQPAASA